MSLVSPWSHPDILAVTDQIRELVHGAWTDGAGGPKTLECPSIGNS